MASETGLHVADLLEAPGLTSTLRERLQAADANGDGIISASEMMDVMQREITATRDRKMMVRVLAALSVACVLIIAAVVGLTYGVVQMSKDTSVENNVLVGKDGLQPLSTATPQQTTPLRDLYQASGPSELQGLTHLTVPFGNGTGIFRIQDVFLVPGQRVRFDTAAEGVSVEVTAEGVTVSGDEQAPGGRRRLMQLEGGGDEPGTAIGPVVSDSTTTESTTTGDTAVPTPASPVGSDSTTTESTTTGDTAVPTPASPDSPGTAGVVGESAASGADDSGTPIPASEPDSEPDSAPASAADLVTTRNKFYLAPNRVTVLCPDADVDDTGVIDGVTYTKRDGDGLRKLVGSANEGALVTSCTTGVTDMSLMFNVRTPPSRVLLFFCRRDGGGGRHPSPRSEIAPHSTRPPVSRCAVERQGLQSAHR